jgi:hypothetical protein
MDETELNPFAHEIRAQIREMIIERETDEHLDAALGAHCDNCLERLPEQTSPQHCGSSSLLILLANYRNRSWHGVS